MKFSRSLGILGPLIFFVLLCIYAFSANQYPSGLSDSDEIITSGYLLTVAHPPGYGLLVILTGLFQRLLPMINPAHAANLLAGIFEALSLALITQSVRLLIKHLIPDSDNKVSKGAIAFGVIAMGLNGLYWLYGTVAEVMALGNFFTALTIYLATKWLTDKTKPIKLMIFTALSFGTGVAHLQTIILLGPGLLYLLISNYPRQKMNLNIKQGVVLITSIVLGFLISSLLIVPLNLRQQSLAWDFPQTINGFINMVKRSDYQGTVVEKGVTVANSYFSGLTWQHVINIQKYLVTLWNQSAGVGVFLPVLGIIFLFQKNRKLFIGYGMLYLVAGLLFGGFVTYPEVNVAQPEYRLLTGTAERQYLVGYTVLALFSGLGGVKLFQMIQSFFTKSIYQLSASICTAVIITTSIGFANASLGISRNDNTIYRYISNILETVEPNSVIICTSDTACYGLYYQSLVEKKRPDVTILNKIPRARHYFFAKNPQYIGFEYPENPLFFAQELAWNVHHRPTYLTSVESFYINYIGLEGNPFYLVPRGLLFKVEIAYPKTESLVNQPKSFQDAIRTQPDDRHFLKLGLLDYVSSQYVVKAQLLTKYGIKPEVIDALENALSHRGDSPEIAEWRVRLDEYLPMSKYPEGVATSSAEYLKQAKIRLASGDTDNAYELARKSAYLSPTSAEPLLLLKEIYQQGNFPHFVNLTEQHLQTLDR